MSSHNGFKRRTRTESFDDDCDKVTRGNKTKAHLELRVLEEKTLPPWDVLACSMSGRVQVKPLRSEQRLRACLKPVP